MTGPPPKKKRFIKKDEESDSDDDFQDVPSELSSTVDQERKVSFAPSSLPSLSQEQQSPITSTASPTTSLQQQNTTPPINTQPNARTPTPPQPREGSAENDSSKKREPRLVMKKMVLNNFKSYAGRQVIGPFHKVRPLLSCDAKCYFLTNSSFLFFIVIQC